MLFVHVRITNPNPQPVPMYWWSNMAVPQTPDIRVLAPAERAWNYSYDNVLRHEPVAPSASGVGGGDGVCGGEEAPGGDAVAGGDGTSGDAVDVSYPARFADAADFFFDVAGHAQPWVAAVDASGSGVFQASTRELLGRKLFRWGTGPGGRRWQRWLSGDSGQPADESVEDPAAGYAEIQAGLARTQFEHVPMPAGATLSWTEAYGRIDLPVADAHGPWARARAVAENSVTAAVPATLLLDVRGRASRLADRAPESVLHTGSGWGALERRLRSRAGESTLDLPGTPFPDDSLGEQQRPWLELLDTGTFPDPAAGEFPASVHLHPLLADLLAASPGWAAPALLGVVRARAGDPDGARQAWELSLSRAENPYARRNLAVLAMRAGDVEGAADHYQRALAVGGSDRALIVEPLRATGSGTVHPALAIEALRADLAAERPDRALALVDRLPVDLRPRGRIRLLEATAALAAGDLDRCGAILTDPDLAVADLREGEDSLDRLWWDYRIALTAAERGIEPDDAPRAEIERTVTVPAHLDFRMHTGPSAPDRG